MNFGIATYGLAYLAGVLSTLSPCVLPLIPIVLGSAIAAHRFGAIALTAGLMLSFAALGTVIASVGASLGFDDTVFRHIGALFLIGVGIVLIVPMLQARLALATSGASNAGQVLLAKIHLEGTRGQFLIGMVLGLVWSPCVGPTLGAAITLASQGRDLLKISLLMAIFGLGAGTPMLILGALSRSMMTKLRGKLLSAGSVGKGVLGCIVLLLGIVTLAGWDKNLETVLVQISPDWLINLTTRF